MAVSSESGASKVTQIVDLYEEKVVRVIGSNLCGSGVICDGKRVLTASHLGFDKTEVYSVIDINQTHYNARCVYICKRLDFAILECCELPEVHLNYNDCLWRGHKFVLLGYSQGSNLSPSVSTGVIRGRSADDIFYIGQPESCRGFSGGPVITYDGKLAGICISGERLIDYNTTVGDIKMRMVEQPLINIISFGNISTHFITAPSDESSKEGPYGPQ